MGLVYIALDKIRHISKNNVCSAEKYTERSSVLLIRLVYFSVEQTLVKPIEARKNPMKYNVFDKSSIIACNNNQFLRPHTSLSRDQKL